MILASDSYDCWVARGIACIKKLSSSTSKSKRRVTTAEKVRFRVVWKSTTGANAKSFFKLKALLRFAKEKSKMCKCQKMFKIPLSTQSCVKSLQMYKTNQKCKSTSICISDHPSESATKSRPNATPEMWNEIVQQMFCELSILMFSRVSLFGVFGCDCAPQELYFDVLSPYNTMLYRISEKLVRHFDVSWLRIYGLL